MWWYLLGGVRGTSLREQRLMEESMGADCRRWVEAGQCWAARGAGPLEERHLLCANMGANRDRWVDVRRYWADRFLDADS